jgi:Baseplate J-like protein
MPLLLPNLDDRTWADLVAESTALIPVYGPEWTDQNYSDPGITIVELLAWIAEMDIYRLNQITDRERLKFLALVGISPKPPQPAYAILNFALKSGAAATLPVGLEFAAQDPSGNPIRFRTLQSLALAPGSLEVLQYKDASGFQNLTPTWARGKPVNPFGAAPQPGAEFYLGFSDAFPVGQPVQIFFTFADGHSGYDQRRRLLQQAQEMQLCCKPSSNPCCKTSSMPQTPTVTAGDSAGEPAQPAPQHWGVRTSWEYLTTVAGALTWVALDATNGQVLDDTRAFTLDGPVTFKVPGAMTSAAVGILSEKYCYLRCRFTAGSYDAAPSLRYPAFNGAACVQSIPSSMSFVISAGAALTYASGTPPNPGDKVSLSITFDDLRNITQLAVGAASPTQPQFTVLQFKPATATAKGCLVIDAAFLGVSDGTPYQQFTLPDFPVEPSTFRLLTFENAAWRNWELRADFDASPRTALHAVLNPSAGLITFGNGEHGRVPPASAQIFAAYYFTAAAGGNLAANNPTWALADSPHNRAALYDPITSAVPDGWTKLQSAINTVTNPLPTGGGAAAETIDLAAGRADQLVTTSGRAVTLADYERLALQTPGARIARVTAMANLHPSFPCFKAPGMVSVIILPFLPQGSPMPSPGLLNAVSAYLRPRRVIGTRVEVVAPTYLDVVVQATVQSESHTNKTALQESIVAALNAFLDPLVGGPDGTGWPFGRDVYRSEIMKVIDSVAGVDYIDSLALLADGGQPQCGNVCLNPTSLVKAGAHRISVL